MPRKKAKRDMTDEEAIKALFPKPVRDKIERELERQPTGKTEKSRKRRGIKDKGK